MTTVLVTGANRGIGLALCEHYGARGDRVIAVCRQPSQALVQTGARIESGVDVTDDQALAALAGRLGDAAIDVLVLNAGVLARDALDRLDVAAFDDMRHQFEVNALGPLRAVAALQDRLPQGAKIGIVTSRMGSMADNSSGGYYGYRASKAAVNAIGRSLAMDLKSRGVAVFLLHPGFVATEMVGGAGDVSPAQSAAQLVTLIDTLGMGETGTFWHANGSPVAW